MRRFTFLSLALALVFSAIVILPQASPAHADTGTNWSGEYFNNRDLVGTPIYVRLDNAINFEWGANSPVPGIVSPDNFSVRWTGAQYFSGGTYVFNLTVDDGARVFVDENLVINAWRDQQRASFTGQMTLSQGQHWVRVEYYDSGDQAVALFNWTLSGAQGAPGGWAAEYYNNSELVGPQAGGRLESGQFIDYNWGVSSPIPGTVNNENFSARWWGFPTFQGGTYTFIARADDGVRVWVDNTEVINAWSAGVYRETRGSITLAPGIHTVRIDYFELVDQARVYVFWTLSSAAPTAVPTVVPTSVAAVPTVTAVITTPNLNVRSGPGISYSVVTQVRQFETYGVTGRSSDSTWYQISGPGFTGWIRSIYAQLNGTLAGVPVITTIGTGAPGLQVQSNASLRVRSRPSTASSRRGALLPGQTAEVIGRTADSSWLQIRLSSGVVGWVSANYVTLIGSTPLTNFPVTG